MLVELKPDQSIVLFSRRIINRGDSTARLVILTEPGKQVEVDRNPFPHKPPKDDARTA
ncbi:MAG: hypothetical protein ACPGWS_00560 [Solirubrobacterales bacterium]